MATEYRLTWDERFGATRLGRWLLLEVLARVDPWLLIATRGWVSTLAFKPILLLQHTGARSGRRRRTALRYIVDGDEILLVAANGGRQRRPAWYYNLSANPVVDVVARRRSGSYRVEEVAGDAYERAWQTVLAASGLYGEYQADGGGRRLPVMRLKRA
jgi:deazaflavin-dependent oxidoreductase (nitroreductase family)